MSRAATGEEAIIQGFLAPLAAGYPGAFGLKDDAALLSLPPGTELVATMDAVASGVHFLPGDGPADIAWKALAVNVSDLVGKGADPHAYLMSLSFPEPPDAGWLGEFANGLEAAQRAFAVTLVGGDTDRRPGPLTVTITALGILPVGTMVRRGSAKPGDRLFVSGTLGDSALGLALRRSDVRAAAWHLDEGQRQALESAYLRPMPPCAVTAVLRAHASAAMDISDGLLKDLDRMARASGVSAFVRADALPLSVAATAVLERDESALSSVLTGGDDYQVLAAVPARSAEAVVAAADRVGVRLTEIGSIGSGEGVTLLSSDGQPIALDRKAASGYDHF